jgi:hypothetical protein
MSQSQEVIMKPRSLCLVVLLGIAALSASSAAQVPQINEPGKPTVAQMFVINRERAEAIPVKLQAAGDVIPVYAQLARQAWEYRQLATPNENPGPALNAAGSEGWEVVALTPGDTRTVWTLKRPK